MEWVYIDEEECDIGLLLVKVVKNCGVVYVWDVLLLVRLLLVRVVKNCGVVLCVGQRSLYICLGSGSIRP